MTVGENKLWGRTKKTKVELPQALDVPEGKSHDKTGQLNSGSGLRNIEQNLRWNCVSRDPKRICTS